MGINLNQRQSNIAAVVCAIALFTAFVNSVLPRFFGWPIPLFFPPWLTILVNIIAVVFMLIIGSVITAFVVDWACMRSRERDSAREPRTTEIVTLDHFLRNPDAIITPNHQEVSDAVARWLGGFGQRHGPKRVFVIRSFDEPYIADSILLVASQLTDADKQALLSFHADNISKLSRKRAVRAFSDLSPEIRVFVVVWD